MRFSTTTVLLCASALLSLFPAQVLAQATQPAPAPANGSAPAATQPAAATEEWPPKTLPVITGILDLEFTTAYYKRGFLQENKSMIFEPTIDISWNAIQHHDGFLSDLGFNVGTRQSIHTNDSHATTSPRAWYESDVFGGINATFFNRIKLDTTYVDITSPNEAFPYIQEFDWQATFLDDGLLGPATVHPYAAFVREIRHSAALGPEGDYLELGLEPAFPIIKSKAFPVRLSFPTRVGLSTHNYYKLQSPFGLTRDETYGFAQAGISAMMPLTFVPHDYGMVFLTAGVDFLFLDHNLTLVNNNNGDAVIGRLQLTWVF